MEDIKPENRFWKEEEWDNYLPEPGFITDFVLATRGIETPTSMTSWTAIWLISSVLKREAWLNWFPSLFFPNFYVILVGPPRVVAKSTAANFGGRILLGYEEWMPQTEDRLRKRVNFISNKATGEALQMVMQPTVETAVDDDGTVHRVERNSEMSLLISELTTMINKKKYNTGLITTFTDLYDCKDRVDDLTITRGHISLKNVYVTMLGCTTPTHLSTEIPEEAFGEGFMSRTILVFEEKGLRNFPVPLPVEGGPTPQDLQKRLAYIAYTCQGEYSLSEEAMAYYHEWYYSFKKQIKERVGKKAAEFWYRLDNHVLKLSLIFRAQRYEPGRVIELTDFKQALAFLEATMETAMNSVGQMAASPYQTMRAKVMKLIKDKGRLTRRQVLQRMSPYGVTADVINGILSHLHQQGVITVERDGKFKEDISNKGQELYTYQEGYDEEVV